jgi:hypothetical protein
MTPSICKWPNVDQEPRMAAMGHAPAEAVPVRVPGRLAKDDFSLSQANLMGAEIKAGEAFSDDLGGQFGFPSQIGLHRVAIAGVAIVVPE